jgi:Tfp pilus assembly protein PilF
MLHPQIFLSYAWKNKSLADEIDQFFASIGIILIRDIRDLESGKSVKEFFNSIGKKDYLIILLSEEYFLSMNCMNEMLELLNTHELKNRILPVLSKDWHLIFSSEKLEDYFVFWKTELKKCNNRLSNNVNEKFLEDKRKIENIYNNLGIIFQIITDLKVQTFDELITDQFMHFLVKINYFSVSYIQEFIQIQEIVDDEEKEIKIDEFLEKHPNDHYGWFQRGVIAYNKQQYRRAEAAYKKVIMLFPQDGLAFYNLAMIAHEKFNNYEQAKLYYEKAIAVNDKYASAHYNYAVLLTFFFKDFKNAIIHYEKTLELNSQHVEANYNLGVLIQDEFPNRAIILYENALKIQPDLAEPHVNLGILIESQLKEYEQARHHFEKAVELNPSLYEAHFNLGRILNNHFRQIDLAEWHLNIAQSIKNQEAENDN